MSKGKQSLIHDYDGKIFGFLEVIGPLDEKNLNGNKLYECRCLVCKEITKAKIGALLRGEKMSCGAPKCKAKVVEYRRKIVTPRFDYAGYSDCNCYASRYACAALEEMFCKTRGYCKFYKPKEET